MHQLTSYKDPNLAPRERAELLLRRDDDRREGAAADLHHAARRPRRRTASRPTRLDAVLGNGIGQVAPLTSTGGTTPQRIADEINLIQRHLVENTRLGVPAVFHNEAIAGTQAPGHVVFPTETGVAATWWPELSQQDGRARQPPDAPPRDCPGARPGARRLARTALGSRARDLRRRPLPRRRLRRRLHRRPAGRRPRRRRRRHRQALPRLRSVRGRPELGERRGRLPPHPRRLRLPVRGGDPARQAALRHEHLLRGQRRARRDLLRAADHVPARTRSSSTGYVSSDYISFQHVVDRAKAPKDAAEAGRLGLEAGLDLELPSPWSYGSRPGRGGAQRAASKRSSSTSRPCDC